TERHQLERVESRVPRGDHREADVRIALRVAVAGEVLEGREHSVVVQPADVFLHQPGDRPRVLPEGADVDDGIQGVVVDVRVRGEIDVDADCAALGGGGRADRVGVAAVSGGAHRHGLGGGGGACYPPPRALFAVRRVEQAP